MFPLTFVFNQKSRNQSFKNHLLDFFFIFPSNQKSTPFPLTQRQKAPSTHVSEKVSKDLHSQLTGGCPRTICEVPSLCV
jgi:hypothetical protein